MHLRLFLALCGLAAFWACSPVFSAEPERIRIFDDFRTDTRKDYQVEGEVTWEKGRLTLGKGAKLTRKFALGHTAEVHAVVRLGTGPGTHGFNFQIQGQGGQAEIALLVQQGKPGVWNLIKPFDKVPLDSNLPSKTDCKVRFEVHYGMARAKAWPQGANEPWDWQTVRYSGKTLWKPKVFVIRSDKVARAALKGLTISGLPAPTALSKEQKMAEGEAFRLHKEVVGLHKEVKYWQALPKAKESLKIYLEILGQKHPNTAASLAWVGFLLRGQGDYAAARPYFEQALAIYKKVLGDQHLDTAKSLVNLGELLHYLGEYKLARGYYEQALGIYKKVLGNNHPLTVTLLNQLGFSLLRHGDYAAARPYFENVLAIKKKVFGNQHPDTVNALDNLGLLLREQGDYTSSRFYYEQALAIHKKALEENYREMARSLENLGALMHHQGEYKAARAYYEQTLAIYKKVRGEIDLRDPFVPFSLHYNLIKLLVAMGEEKAAWDYLAPLVQKVARRVETSLAGQPEGRLAMDSVLFNREWGFDYLLSLAEAASVLPRQHGDELLGNVLSWKAKSSRALAQRQEALEISGNAEAAKTYAELKQVRQLWVNVTLRGPGQEGVEKHQQLLQQLAERLGELERNLGRKVESFAAQLRARGVGAKELGKQLQQGDVLVEFVKYLNRKFKKIDRQERGQLRYAAVLLSRAANTPSAPLIEEGKKLGEPVIQFHVLGEAKPIDDALHAWRKAAQKQKKAIPAAIEKELRQRLWEPLAKVLPKGTKRLVLATDGELGLLPFEAIKLADDSYLVEKYQVCYVSSGLDLLPRPRSKAEPGPALVLANPDYDALGRTGVSPVPHRPEAGATSQANTKRDGDDFRKKKYRFEQLPGFAAEAAAVAQALKKHRPVWQLEQKLGSAADEEGLQAIQRPRLLYCITHGFFLPDLLPPKDDPRLMRGLAIVSLDQSKPYAPLPRFGKDPRLRSGLALAGANRWPERIAKGHSDGLLTALEASNLDLRNTELVVLSACETGVGQVQIGEGVLGLRRAFQGAGARTVLASLWRVPDKETGKLMSRFFELWLTRTEQPGTWTKAEALRQSQLELIAALRKEPDEVRRTAPPRLWAGFICHGQP